MNFQPSAFNLQPCFLGATPEREVIRRNDFLRIALFWEALEAPAQDYQVSLQLLATNGEVALAETSRPSFGRYPTPRWRTGERVRDNHALWIPIDFQQGPIVCRCDYWMRPASRPALGLKSGN
jgi:hypothetical protein